MYAKVRILWENLSCYTLNFVVHSISLQSYKEKKVGERKNMQINDRLSDKAFQRHIVRL